MVGIKDDKFLRRLIALGVRPEVAVALVTVPLVFVAWGDGTPTIGSGRRSRVRAPSGGWRPSASRRSSEERARQKPDPKLFEIWTAYVRRLWGCFTADERWEMRGKTSCAPRAKWPRPRVASSG